MTIKIKLIFFYKLNGSKLDFSAYKQLNFTNYKDVSSLSMSSVIRICMRGRQLICLS